MSTKILIIEKDDPRLRLLEWGLREDGLEVAHASDPATAGLDGARPDVIVFNTGMPVASKRVWIDSLRYMVPGVRIVDLAAEGEFGTGDSGADAYLAAPFRIDELQTIISRLVPGGIVPRNAVIQ
jgi:DNA-binding response OmpR family regulator